MKKLILVLLLFSIARLNAQNITAAEYFFDVDPGLGNGTPVTISLPGSTVTFPVNIPVNTLGGGFHWLALRVKDADGKWGLYERRSFYLPSAPTDMPVIVAAEYFYDNDPGVGNATSLQVNTPGNIVIQNFAIPVPQSMAAGNHFLTIRVKDQNGAWSLFEKDTITVGAPSGSITCPGNVTVDPFTNNCKAVVNNIDAVGLPADDSSYTYTLTGATTGNGIGTASGQLFNAGVTTVTYALINSPTVSCSFTVTVYSNVTPTVTMSVPNTIICEGTLITFACTYTGGGFFTTAWQWKKNGLNVGSNSNIYRDSMLQNNDTITVALTSAISCAVPQTVISAPVIMTVHDTITPTVSIIATATTVCPGQAVTFTATPINGGSQPLYDWVKNGVSVASGSVYQTSALANGDSVYVLLTNTTDCITAAPVKSNVIHITTSQMATPSVTVSASSTSVCTGQQVTFTASTVNGGASPTYQWKVNGNNVGDNSPTFESSALNNGDNVSVVMTSSLACANPQSAESSPIPITVLPSSPAFVSIAASSTIICSGSSVTFNVTAVNPGATYQWQSNGNNIAGATGTTYQSSSFQNGDKIKVIMTPATPCATPYPAVSNEITMTVNSDAASSVTINASSNIVCSNQTVTFTATPVNAGTNIVYEWILNGNVVGSNSNVYQSSSLVNGDKIKVTMVSWQPCGGYNQAVSNTITMTVNTAITPLVAINATLTTACANTTVSFTATPTNGGNNPSYQWKLNGNNVGMNSALYENSNLVNGDLVQVIMTSSLSCADPLTDTSNTLTMTILQPVIYYKDVDGDSYGSAGSGTVQACSPQPGYVINNDDCNDNNINVHPGATETCGNGVDDDCDGSIDEGCAEQLPVLLVRTYPVKEGDAGHTVLNVEVKLDQPGLSPVSVNYSTGNANATAGSDYVAANGILTIPVGAVSGIVQVRIIGDLLSENNESFWINFSNPVNVVLGSDPRARIMIIDDDKGKPTTRTTTDEITVDQPSLKIPTVTKRNQVWMIPQIGNYENEVLVTNVQGQVITRFINYKNQIPVGNIAAGLYFYRIKVTDTSGQVKFYSGRLLVTE